MDYKKPTWFGSFCMFTAFFFTLQLIIPQGYIIYNPPSIAAGRPMADVTGSDSEIRSRIESLGSALTDFLIAPAGAQTAPVSTPEVDLSDPYLIAKAGELGNDPEQIFAFVRDEIAYEVYAGSLRGARGTLWNKAGNGTDQASLLIALLRIAGFSAGYVQGTLADADAQALIASMFEPEPYRVVGFIPDDVQPADPLNDPELIAEARQHTWVEADLNGSSVSLDPSFRTALTREAFTTPGATFAEIPDSQRHKVTLHLNAAFGGNVFLSILNPGGVTESRVFEHTLNTSEVVGRPLILAHQIDSETQSSLIGSNYTHVYTPYLLIGRDDGIVDEGPYIFGSSYQEFLSSFLGSLVNRALLQLTVDVTVTTPTGVSETFSSALLDLISSGQSDIGDPAQPRLNVYDLTALLINSSLLNPALVETRADRLESLGQSIQELEPELNVLAQTDPGQYSDADVLLLDNAIKNFSAYIGTLLQTLGEAGSIAQEQLRQLNAYAGVSKAYFDQAGVQILHSRALADNRFDLRLEQLQPGLRVTPFPGQADYAEQGVRYGFGLAAWRVKYALLEQFIGPSNAVFRYSDEIVDTLTDSVDDELVLLEQNNTAPEDIDDMTIPLALKQRLAQRLAQGAVIMAGRDDLYQSTGTALSWLEIDPDSGRVEDFIYDLTLSTQAFSGSALQQKSLIQYVSLLARNFVRNQRAQYFLGTISGFASGSLAVVAAALTSVIDQELGGLAKQFLKEVDARLEELAQKVLKKLKRATKAFKQGFETGLTMARKLAASVFDVDPEIAEAWIGLLPDDGDLPVPGSGVISAIVPEDFFTLPVAQAQLSSLYRIYIRNGSATTVTYDIELPPAPAGFRLITSLPRVSVPAGETGIVGLAVIPQTGLPAPGTSVPFQITLTNPADPGDTLTPPPVEFIAPAVTALELSITPDLAATAAGDSFSAELTVSNIGNVDASAIPLTATLDDGLALSGLPATLDVAEGAMTSYPLTFSADAGSLNQDLLATIGARFGQDLDGNPYEATANVTLRVRSPAVLPIEQYAVAADQAGNEQLAQTLRKIAELSAQLEQDPDNAALQDRLVFAYDQLLQLADVNPALAALVVQIEALRNLAAAGDSSALLADAQQLFTDNPPPPAGLVLPRISFAPAGLELEPGGSDDFTLRLENPGSQALALDLAVGAGLPGGVTAQLNRTGITLAPGEVVDASSTDPVQVSVSAGAAATPVFALEILATYAAASPPLAATGLVVVRESLADVLAVTVTPNALDTGERDIEAGVQIVNSANVQRTVLALPEVLDGAGSVALTLPETELELVPGIDPLAFDLGSQSLIGLAEGAYQLRVSLLDGQGNPLPGRSAQTPFYLGELITAQVRAEPVLVAPGDAQIGSTIEVTNRAALSSGEGSLAALVQYHQPDAVVGELSDLDNAVGDPQTVLGAPQAGDFVSLNGGILTLDLGPDGNHAIDGPGDDLIIYEASDNERYIVEVSLDAVTFVTLGQYTGNGRIDLQGSGLSEIRYVRLIDQLSLINATPGADIEGMRVLNSKGGIKVERVAFLGQQNYSDRFGNSGFLSVPLVANIDDDPTPEILVSTDTFPTAPRDRFFAIDGVSAISQFEIIDNITNTRSAAVAELDAASAGPEIALSRSNGRLQLFSADGALLWDVAGGTVSPVIANVDADPEPEIIATDNLLDIRAFNADGTTAWDTAIDADTAHPSAIVAADLDGDGINEVIATSGRNSIVVFQAPADGSAVGVLLWEFALGGATFGGPAVADVDADGLPEIIVGDSSGIVSVINDDGSVLKRIQLSGRNISPPSVADINGDGISDIVITAVGPDQIYALNLNDAVLASPDILVPLADALIWVAASTDSTNSGSGISVYDLDGDGIWEVVWNGFGPEAEQEYGGLTIYSGLDGTVIYNNPRINSRTWDENVTIADVDGDGHAELVAGDQEGVWIIGADDLWIGARDIWNQQSYHITNINADLNVPAQEPLSWLDHNSYRTQRPPTGAINRLDLQISHGLPAGGYQVDAASIDPAADSVGADTIGWNTVRRFNDAASVLFSLSGDSAAMAPGEIRAISTGTTVTARYTDDSGQLVEVPLSLPALTVTAAHIISLTPPLQTVDAGDSATYQVVLSNPTASAQSYTLAAAGLEGLEPQLTTTLEIPAGATITTPLTLTTPQSASGERVFNVRATTASGGSDSVLGRLQITPADVVVPGGEPPEPIELTSLAVDVQLMPAAATAGQGTAAPFTVRVTNTGDEAASFDLNGVFPFGFAAQWSETQLTLLPGLSNYRDVALRLTAPAGTAVSDYPFSVSATAVSDAGVSDTASGQLGVLGLGVELAISPASTTPAASVQLSVTNRGQSVDTYSLQLGGEASGFAALAGDSVTLNAGETQLLDISIDAIDLALPGSLELFALATSQTDTGVQDTAAATVLITPRRGVSATFEPAEVLIAQPGAAQSALLIRNTGNVDDSYDAVLDSIPAPLLADFVGADGELSSSVGNLRLPPLAIALIELDVEVLDYGRAMITADIGSQSDATVNDQAEVLIGTQNRPPLADAGEDRNALSGTPVFLDGSASYDPDGDLINFGWTLEWNLSSRPAGSQLQDTDLAGRFGPAPSFVPDVDGDYIIELNVDDGVVSAVPDYVTVNAYSGNVPPNADAGADVSALVGQSLTLDGSASVDPDAGPETLGYEWSILQTPAGSAAVLSDAAAVQPLFNPDLAGTYRLQLTVSDGLDSDVDEVQIDVFAANVPPNADAGPDRTLVQGELVQLDGSASVDPDNAPQPLSYQWQFISLPAGSVLSDADIITSDQALAQFQPDVQGSYLLQLQVSDGEFEDRDGVRISTGCVGGLSADPATLWSPNHDLRPVLISVANACEDIGSAAVCRIDEVTSNQPINGPGDGNTDYDWNITGPLTVELRAERSGVIEGDRIYTMAISCIEPDGQRSYHEAYVNVPHNQ